MKKLSLDQKYDLYSEFVQDPKRDVRLLTKFYKEARKGKIPLHVKEDFCGTFYFAKEWIRSHSQRSAMAVDLDWEPLSVGYKKYYNLLKPEEQKRLKVVQGDVCKKTKPAFDICFASNFSYNCLKERASLKNYFLAAYQSLNRQGILVLDHFGGTDCMLPYIEGTYLKINSNNWYYDWELKKYNPTTTEALYYIHFSRSKTRIQYPKTFTYHWRMWTLTELRDLMLEVGFKKVQFYWENSKNDLVLNPSTDLSLSTWIAHLVAIK